MIVYLCCSDPSAWKNWTYILKVSSQGSADEDLAVSNISHTNFTVRDLSNFTAYEVSVRALSPAGEGPWSESFKGTTLKEGKNDSLTEEK